MSPTAQTIAVTSEAFEDGATIPKRYTCDGQDVSPPLRWTGVPDGTAELALVVDDSDAPGGTFVHWVLYAIPGSAGELEEGRVPDGAAEGPNDFGRRGWGGPCPPRGHGAHRYIFHLYGLSKPLGLPAGATAAAVREAMRASVAGEGTLTGRYGR